MILRRFVYAIKQWRYGLLYRLRSGMSISISLTFRCNYQCPYCTMTLGKNRRVASESTLEQWKEIIDTFPGKLKEVFISGGEPTLVSYWADLANYLVSKRILVVLYTNFTGDITKVKPSSYFKVLTTYHPQAKEVKFWEKVKLLGKTYQIEVDEVGNWRPLSKARVKHEITTIKELKADRTRIRFAPDRTIYLSCYDLFYSDDRCNTL